MMLRTIVFAFLAVAVLAEEFNLPEDKAAQLRAMLVQQCKKNNAEDKVDQVENVGKSFVNCVKSLFDMETLKKEIEEAKPNGALDEVFKKYCAKTPELKSCIYNLLDGVSPCLDGNMRDQINSAKNGTDQFIDFICYKDGDRIALFIAEGGPQCFQSKANEIRTCAENIKEGFKSVDEVKSLTLAQKCAKFDELSSCVVNKLEGCETPTPANMAESLFRFVRKGSPCNDVKA
ncbi:27 kDa hemolymph protein-like [Helicoverpa zea]|uniref:27 kDa hemolymph protein-like n=1 Tax=Helicoverpa zea TaxID=7113 RepID=UPI001F5678E8|nr:27 kDa hemolymph protein-like [Helicoverpa zea]XP_047020579.1 27 kDa hemolymph protein-like [Helicoverpa zea]